MSSKNIKIGINKYIIKTKYFQVIFTMSNGKTVIELWKNGEVVEDANQVLETNENTESSTAGPNTIDTDDSESKIAVSNNPKDDSTEHKAETTTVKTPILLDKLRTAIRSGDKSVLFTIGNENSNLQQSRRPKFRKSNDETLAFIQNLRKETEKNNKNFLMTVFSRVNGDVNRKRRKRETNYVVNRKTDTKSR